MKKWSTFTAVGLTLLLTGCAQSTAAPTATAVPPTPTSVPSEGALMSVSELLEDPLCDSQVNIYGQVSLLGDLRCPCFELTSGGKTVLVGYVWYEGDVAERPAVSVEGIENGDQVIVTGELKPPGADSLSGFWASKIESGQ